MYNIINVTLADLIVKQVIIHAGNYQSLRISGQAFTSLGSFNCLLSCVLLNEKKVVSYENLYTNPAAKPIHLI